MGKRRRWTTLETKRLLRYIAQSGAKFEKPTIKAYYKKMIADHQLDFHWDAIRQKVSYMKRSLKNANEWRKAQCNEGFRDEDVMHKIKKMCPFYNELNKIFSDKLKIRSAEGNCIDLNPPEEDNSYNLKASPCGTPMTSSSPTTYSFADILIPNGMRTPPSAAPPETTFTSRLREPSSQEPVETTLTDRFFEERKLEIEEKRLKLEEEKYKGEFRLEEERIKNSLKLEEEKLRNSLKLEEEKLKNDFLLRKLELEQQERICLAKYEMDLKYNKSAIIKQ